MPCHGRWEGMDMTTESESTIETHGPEETEALGEKLASTLSGGEVVALIGDLGSGKTTFIRGLARGLGVEDPGSVRSPSYTLVVRYQGPLPLLHLDAYFMQSFEDLKLCGIDDSLALEEVVAIEWGDKVCMELPSNTIRVLIEHLSQGRRTISICKGYGSDKPGDNQHN